MKWKKFGAIAVAGVLACSALCLSPFKPSAEAVDLMQDTFETGYGSWKGVGSTITITSDEAHGGTKSLYVHDRTASWGAPRCSIPGKCDVSRQRFPTIRLENDLHRQQRNRSLRQHHL